MSSWTSHHPAAQDAVSVLLAGEPGIITSWYNALVADGRFRVGSFANDPQDLQLKMANQPEVLVLQARIFPGPPPLVEFLSGAPAAVYVVLPGDVPDDVIGQIRALTSVKGAFRGDANLPELTGRMFETAQALRQQAPALEGAWRPSRGWGDLRAAHHHRVEYVRRHGQDDHSDQPGVRGGQPRPEDIAGQPGRAR